MYKTANDYYKEKYGCKVYKLSIDGGFTCPNRDGTVSTGGCIFCSAQGSGEFAEGTIPHFSYPFFEIMGGTHTFWCGKCGDTNGISR